ncbi:hypothetical protein PG985_013201 [Apiospora marii]|uniref:MYND-type domain-containing protein n=1 Tax=Apiospora marii TaxID=335849 RepID=A0ABR1R8L1_9PEZI
MSQPPYDGPHGPLQHRCASCDAVRPNLLKCTGCRLVRYCSRDHQAQHRPQHKSLCKHMGKLRTKLEHEDYHVRHATQDFMTPANAFETHVGHFWAVQNTREYMRARFALADEARLACTLDGVTEALDHFQDMLRLCRSDNMGIRDHLPSLMLRLNRDQECYDLIKWWETAGREDDYDWGDTDLPFLDIKNADVTEEPEFLLHRFGNLGFLVSIMLLKVKMLIDIRNIKVVRKVVTGRLPIELWRPIERSAVSGPLSHRFLARPYGDLDKVEGKLLRQCLKIGTAITQTNGFLTRELLSPRRATFDARPGAYSKGSREEMVLTMHEVYPAWCETVGALDLLHDAQACATHGFRQEVATMQNICGQQNAAAKRKLQEMVTDKTWDMLKLAVQDSAYLGPPAEKPSVQHARDHQDEYELPPVRILGGSMGGMGGMGDLGDLGDEDDMECNCFDHDFYHRGRDPWGEAYEAGIL